ncbi:MAG: type IX secretion system membrane protein PorP/SprF [Salibacteraceae bacterium]
MEGKMRIKYILLVVGLHLSVVIHAQQVGRYSMYMQNFYAVNPAAAGLEEHLDATIGYRQQWIGMPNAPQNYFISANMPLKKEFRSPVPGSIRISDPSAYKAELPASRTARAGIGAMANVNQYGAFKYTQLYATYAYHLPVTKKMNLSFGANVGLNMRTIDQQLITLEMPDDPYYSQVITDVQQNSSMLDIDIGFMLYARKFFVGYSSEQLLGNTVVFGSNLGGRQLIVHHKLLLGKTIWINRKLKAIPNGFIYFTRQGLLSLEANVRLDYRDQVWAGLSYRHQDAVIPMFGVYINDQIKIGYAYDLNIGGLRRYVPGGSHEIMLGFMFGNKREVF